MSANNWAICPRCLKRATDKADADFAASRAEWTAKYGHMTVAELQASNAPMPQPKPAPVNRNVLDTFREDYEVRMSDTGKFSIWYGGECERCGLKHEFKHESQIEGVDL